MVLGTNGVKVISYGTMKGLEFDIVILPRFETVNSTKYKVADRNRAYVATSRARDDLYICYFDINFNTPKWIDTMPPIKENKHLFLWE